MEKEKLQHYSIRKLSVGAASVLIGLSFVGMGSNQVKADTLSQSESQTQEQQVTDKSINQSTENENKSSQVQVEQTDTKTDSKNVTPVQDQTRSLNEDKEAENNVATRTQTSPQLSDERQQNNQTSGLTVKTNELTPKTTDYSKLSVTDKSLNKTSLLAQQATESNPVKESNVELNRQGYTESESTPLADKTRMNGLQDSIRFGMKGKFKVDGTALNSAGVQIKLADITESNNVNGDLSLNPINHQIWSWIKDGDNIGTFSLQKDTPHHIALLLQMSKNEDFVGDVDINVNVPDCIQYNFMVPAKQYKGVSSSKPLEATINTGMHSYQFEFPFNAAAYYEYEYPDDKIDTWQNGSTAGAENARIPFVDDNLNKTTLIHELEQSHGSSMSAELRNLKRVVQISGSNLSENIADYDPVWSDCQINVIDANGKLTNDTIGVATNFDTVKKVQLADDLTPQEIYQQTSSGTFGFSKQADGSWLVCWNISPANYQMTDLENNIRNNSVYANIIDPQNADKIVKNTVDFYTGALKNTPLNITSGVFLPANHQTDFTIKDLTPGDDRHNQDTGFIGEATTNADGSIARYVNVQTVDDDNNQLIIGKPQIIRGKTGDIVDIKYTVPVNYELVPNQSIPSDYALKDTNNPIVIHLRHKRQSAVDSKVVAETIHYVYEDGSKALDDYNAKHVVLDRTGYKDLVTGKTVFDGDWSTGEFPEVTSSKINGYTADQSVVAAVAVDGNTQDIVKTVVYKANNQKIIVNYIDQDANNQVIHSDSLVGKTKTTANYSVGDVIKGYLAQGYDLVSDETEQKPLIYDADDTKDQVYTVRFKHHILTVTDPKMLNATFDRVVTTKLPSGENKQSTQHYVITRTGTQDQVTKAYKFSNWSTANVHEDAVQVFDGYTARINTQTPNGIAVIDKGMPVVKAEIFTNENNNSTTPVNRNEVVEVVYDANIQKACVNYIDDSENKTLSVKNLSGKSNTDSNYSTQNSIKDYLSKGYDLVSDDTSGRSIIFDAKDKVDQIYNVHLKHHISTVTDSKLLTATFDRTVNEKQPSGKIKQYTQHYVITRTGTQDQVTKAYKFSNWSTANVHEDDGSVFDGYTAVIGKADPIDIATVVNGKPIVKAEVFTNANDNSANPVNKVETIEIDYDANDQRARVNYIDDTDKTLLVSKKLKGKSDSDSDYSTKEQLEYLLKQGYDLVSDDTEGKNIVFDAHDKVDQVYEVHVEHHLSPVTDQRILTATFDRVITEHTPDGKDKQITQHYVITRTGKQDQVTKKYAWSDWTTVQVHEDKGDTFEGYTPHLSGNNLDSFISLVNGTPIAKEEVFTNENGKLLPKNISEKVDITYTANPQEAAIVFYDDTADTPLQKNTVRGHYGEAIEFTPKVSDVITEYTKKGYVLVSNEFDNQKYAADDKQNVFVVHLKHGTVDVTRSKAVTETIHYIYDNDSKAHDDYVATKQFVNHGTKDLVTGNIVWQNAWAPANDEFAQVNSPEIPGYTPDKSSIPAQKVNVDSKNLEFTVKYSAIPAEPSSNNDPEPSNPVPEKPIETTPDTPVSTPDDNISKEESYKPKKHEPAIRKASRTHSTPVVDHFAAPATRTRNTTGNATPKKVAEIKPGMERKAQAASIEKSSTVSEPRAKELPTTGEKDEDQLGYVGLALASLVGIFGYSIKKRED